MIHSNVRCISVLCLPLVWTLLWLLWIYYCYFGNISYFSLKMTPSPHHLPPREPPPKWLLDRPPHTPIRPLAPHYTMLEAGVCFMHGEWSATQQLIPLGGQSIGCHECGLVLRAWRRWEPGLLDSMNSSSCVWSRTHTPISQFPCLSFPPPWFELIKIISFSRRELLLHTCNRHKDLINN